MKSIAQQTPVQFTATNFLIVIAGTLVLAYGLHRMFPLRFNRGFALLNGPLAFMLLMGLMLLMWKHGEHSYRDWGCETAKLAGRFLPLMVLLCLVMAIGSILTRIHEAEIQSFLLRHRIIGPFVASLLTPTSNALVSVVETAWKKPELQPMCLYYMQASVMMSVPLYLLRTLGFAQGSAIPGKMYAMGVIISIAMLFLMRPAFWLTEALCDFAGAAWSTVWPMVNALF